LRRKGYLFHWLVAEHLSVEILYIVHTVVVRTVFHRTWTILPLLKRHRSFLSLHQLMRHALSLRPVFEFKKPVSEPRQVVVQHPLTFLLSRRLIAGHVKFNFFQKQDEFLVLSELRYRLCALFLIHLASGLLVLFLGIVNPFVIAQVNCFLKGHGLA